MAVVGNPWYPGPKPRDAQLMALSQQGEPFGTWLRSTRVPESFHVRPSANGDTPQCVVGMMPGGHLRAPILSAI
jgi:hypothetical protein